MIFDCHANCGWDMSNTRKNLHPTEQSYKQLLLKMELAEVEKAVIVPFPSPGGQFSDAPWYDVENNYLVQAVNYSSRFVMFPAVNPGDKNSVRMIKTLAVMRETKGVKFSHQIPMNVDIDALIGHPLMDIVEDNKLIMMIHIGTGKERGIGSVHTTLDYAVRVARKYPSIRFIFCHLGRLHSSLMEALNLHNVYTDTAGLALQHHWKHFIAKDALLSLKNLTPQHIIEKLVDFGYEDKIMFGSDEPYTSYNEQISHIKNADISTRAKEKILYDNMTGLLN
jgi:predicted TIM-barrel fold metal-dependent hydrolase